MRKRCICTSAPPQKQSRMFPPIYFGFQPKKVVGFADHAFLAELCTRGAVITQVQKLMRDPDCTQNIFKSSEALATPSAALNVTLQLELSASPALVFEIKIPTLAQKTRPWWGTLGCDES